MSERVLVTGGLGFIGANLLHGLTREGHDILNVDRFSYAADEHRLKGTDASKIETVRLDVADEGFRDLVAAERPSVIFHLAAESHVTRSENDPDAFFRSNVLGTTTVMEAAEAAGVELVVHFSTDEVYGPCPGAPFKESDKLPGEGMATSAYARSKALGDDVARSFMERLPVIVVRPTNCFGPWQHPEKAIPRWCIRVLQQRPVPVWGDGRQVRDWMFVSDLCDAIQLIWQKGHPGETYNVGPGESQRTNLEIATLVAASGHDPNSVYLTEYDRPQHDRRYAVDATKLHALGWNPATTLERGLEETMEFYRSHEKWWSRLVEDAESIYRDSVAKAR